jgi:chromosomal replication initiator protein
MREGNDQAVGKHLSLVREVMELAVAQPGWKLVSDRLQESINPQTYEVWIRPLQEMAVADGIISVTAPDSYHRKWVLSRYGTEIDKALGEVAPDHKLEIVIRSTETAATNGDENPGLDELHQPSAPQAESQKTLASVPAANGLNELSRPLMNPLLDARYTFDSFVAGSSNQVAHASAKAVANNPGRAFNPLFLAGVAGLGKTHLLNAIGHDIYRRDPKMRIFCLPAERFMNEYVGSIQRGRSLDFKDKYRHGCDLLLIDDVHTLAGKEGTQEEFFHIFNWLYDHGRQIVLTSDKYPKDMANLEERLRSRFEWGLIADIQPPDLETKLAIIHKKAEMMKLYLPDEVSLFLASLSTTNVRDLEGYLVRIRAYSQFQDMKVSIENVQEWLSIHMGQQREASVEDIIKKVAEYYSLKPAELKSASRKAVVTEPRHLAMYIAREITNFSFPEIGSRFGGRNHATVIHAHDKMRTKVQSDPQYAALVKALIRSLQ